LLLATIILGTLSLPFAIQAHDLSGLHVDSENRERVRTILASLPLEEGFTADGLSSDAALAAGRDALVHKCTPCHDLRTILYRPRAGDDWFRVVRRMADKPVITEPL